VPPQGGGRALQAFADAEDVAVGMADVHLTDIPRHVGWRKGHLETRGQAVLVNPVDILNPNAHPHAFVAGLVTIGSKSRPIGSLPTATLRSLAEKYFKWAGTDGAESGWVAPVPAFLPTEFFEPSKARVDIADTENGSDMFGVHGWA